MKKVSSTLLLYNNIFHWTYLNRENKKQLFLSKIEIATDCFLSGYNTGR